MLLTPVEKQMAHEVCMAFGQVVSLLTDQDDQLIDCEAERHCEKIGEGESLSSCKHTLAAAAAFATVALA